MGSPSKLSLLTKEQIKTIIENNKIFSQVLKEIGYIQLRDKNTIARVKQYCTNNQIDYSHLIEDTINEFGEIDYSIERICNICGKKGTLKDFYFIKNKPLGYCKECHKLKIKQKYQERTQEMNEFKKTLSCKKCGENRFYLLDFHHVNPNEKEFEISNHSRTKLKDLQKEIDKCIPLCSNCHREFHYLNEHENIELNQYLKQ